MNNATQALSPSAQRVQDALRARGFEYRVVEYTTTTRSAAEAAQTIGCEVGQIAKSLVFKGRQTQTPVLVIASGVNRVDEARVADVLGEPIGKADADFVRRCTGFAIGGVPPLGHHEPLTVLIDQALFHYQEIWAAAGTPNAIFRLVPADLPVMTGGRVVAIT